MIGLNSSFPLKGTMSTFVGATTAGSERTYVNMYVSQCIKYSRFENTYATLDVLLTAPEDVLKQ
jgi:hypothetical protein